MYRQKKSCVKQYLLSIRKLCAVRFQALCSLEPWLGASGSHTTDAPHKHASGALTSSVANEPSFSGFVSSFPGSL